MITKELLLLQLLNGLALGVLYVLIASGLSVIFGVTDILNFAHGVLYALGAYLAFTIIGATGSFWLALLLAPLAVAILGVAVERTTLHNIYDRDPLYHVLLTFGLVLMLTAAIEAIWGVGQQQFDTPQILSGAADLGVIIYPKYKLFVIGVGAVVAFGTWSLLKFTNFGLVLRAGAQSQQTVRFMGIDISKYFTLVFGVGSLLAGMAGVLAGPYLNVNPHMGEQIIIIAFIVVVVGGLGSFAGSVVAGLLIGLLQTFGIIFLPKLGGFLVYLIMVLILLFRPQGILGQYEIRKESAKITFDKTLPLVRLSNRKIQATLVFFALLPVGIIAFWEEYYLGLLALMFIWGIFALGLDIVVGYMGLLSFGHAAFFGLGAYTLGLVTIHFYNSFLLAAVIAVLLSGIVAWAIGALSIRLAGVYFAMITLAFAQMFHQLSVTFNDITGGSNGLSGIPSVQLIGLDLSEPLIFYYFTFALLIGIYYATVRLLDSPFGRVLSAVRESERRASFLGYNTNKYKRRAFALSGAISGIAGALFASYNTFVSPNTLHWTTSGDVLFALIFGGMGTLYGPLIGGGIFIGLNHVLPSYFDQWRFVLGLLLVLVVLFAPRGLVSLYLGVVSRFKEPDKPPIDRRQVGEEHRSDGGEPSGGDDT